MRLLFLSAFISFTPLISFASDLACGEPPSKLFSEETTLPLVIRGEFLRSEIASPGEVRIKADNGSEKVIPVSISGRGKSRAGCAFRPLRLEWTDKTAREGTSFDHVAGSNIKLIVHCDYKAGTIAENEQANLNVVREYAVYKMIEALGLPTFRARLAKINYQNPDGTALVEGMGVLLEPSPALGRRCGLKHVSAEGKKDVWAKPPALQNFDKSLLASFLVTRLIADASDYWIEIGHNLEAYIDDAKITRALIPYDYNDSSLVVGRGVEISFSPDKNWYGALRSGPFKHDGQFMQLTAEEKLSWTHALLKVARTVVSNATLANEALDRAPLDDQSRLQIKHHLEKQVSELKKITVESENAAP